jgi:hypothetical protein
MDYGLYDEQIHSTITSTPSSHCLLGQTLPWSNKKLKWNAKLEIHTICPTTYTDIYSAEMELNKQNYAKIIKEHARITCSFRGIFQSYMQPCNSYQKKHFWKRETVNEFIWSVTIRMSMCLIRRSARQNIINKFNNACRVYTSSSYCI